MRTILLLVFCSLVKFSSDARLSDLDEGVPNLKSSLVEVVYRFQGKANPMEGFANGGDDKIPIELSFFFASLTGDIEKAILRIGSDTTIVIDEKSANNIPFWAIRGASLTHDPQGGSFYNFEFKCSDVNAEGNSKNYVFRMRFDLVQRVYVGGKKLSANEVGDRHDI